MKNEKSLTKEEMEMYARAIIEKKVFAKDLLAEILPLIEECIIADYELTDDELIVNLLNGQKFKIAIIEIL